MQSRLLVSGLPRSLPSLPRSPAPPCLPCVEGRQRAAPHSSEFPPTTAPLQTLHIYVWGPAPVGGTDQERYYQLIRATHCQLRERFRRDLQVQRLHSDRGGEFSSDLLAELCRDEGICQSFTLPASPQQNGIADRCIGLIMEVARTSMIHAVAPHFLWPFAVRYVAYRLSLWPRFSEPETSPTLRWTGKVGNASVFRVWGALSLVRNAKATKLSSRTLRSVFLGFPTDASPWQFYHPHSQSCSLRDPPGFPPRPSSPPPQPAAVDSGAETAGAELGGEAYGGAEPESEGSRGADSGGTASPSGGGAVGDPTGGPGAGQPQQPGLLETLSPQQIRAWIVRRGSPGGGGYGPSGARAASPGGTASAGGAGGTDGGAGGAASVGGTRGAASAGGAGAANPGGTGGAARAGGAGGTVGGAAGTGGTARGARGATGGGGNRDAAGAGGAGAASPGGTGGAAGAGGARATSYGSATTHRDYELHSLDFSTAFPHGSLHEEIWLRRPPGFTGSFSVGTLRRPVYGLRQAPREWHDTLRTTLAALGFAPSSADPSLFLRTDTTLPSFYVLVYVDDLVFATAYTKALALVKAELHERHTCTDMGELRSYLGLQITRGRVRRTITLTQSHMVHQVLRCFAFQFSSPQPTPLSTDHSLSAPPSDESVEPSGPYPELLGCLMYLMTCTQPDPAYPLSLLAHYVAPGRHQKVHWDAAKRVLRYLCSRSGMGLVLGGRGLVVLTGHSDASWADNQATQHSSQSYTFSLGSSSVSWRSTRFSSMLGSSFEAEIYAGAMAAQELRWLTYLLTDLGERPRSPLVLYVDKKAMLALCWEQRLEHRTKHIVLRYFLARELQQRG
ncbi:unnamed protein product [Closterium sp. NIES-54]